MLGGGTEEVELSRRTQDATGGRTRPGEWKCRGLCGGVGWLLRLLWLKLWRGLSNFTLAFH